MNTRVPLTLALLLLATACQGPDSPASAPPNPSRETEATVQTVAASLTSWTQAQREVMARTKVPVLLPSSPALRAKAVLTGEASWFAAHIPDADTVITLEGNLTATEHPEIAKAFEGYPVGTRAKPRVGRNELVVEAAWLEDGVAWSLEVSCMHPDTNPKCTEDTHVLGLVAGLRRWSLK